MPLRFSDFPGQRPLEAVALGESNRDILSSYLGYSSAEIDNLYDVDVIKTDGK